MSLGLLLFILFLCPCSNAGAQIIAVQADKMNVAYIGVSNPIVVAVDNAGCNELSVSVRNGQIEGAGCNYVYHPADKPGTLEIIQVFKGVGTQKKLLQQMEVRIKELPDPVVTIAGREAKYITRKDMLLADGPDVSMRYFDYDAKWTIVSCQLTIATPGSEGQVVFSQKYTDEKGVRFDDAARKIFGKLCHDDKVILEDIEARGPDGAERKLASRVYSIAW